jgi:hypothetical protein
MPHFRTYHSTAGLLPDGRVLSTGSTAPSKPSLPDQLNADFYSPPYLFKGTRPTISGAPILVNYGQKFAVDTPDAASISNVNFIGLSAVTHHFNFNQRINRLTFTKTTGALTVTAPANANLCPPGHYMMFILNSAGAPSVAKIVQIAPAAAPSPTPTATPTPTAGAGGSMKWNPKAAKFGKVRVGQSKVRTIKIKNGGHQPLTGSAQEQGMAQFALGADSIQFTVNPKGASSIAVRFTPTSPGPASGSIKITSSDPAHRSVTIGLSGTGK